MKDKILIDEPVREERIGESRDQNRIDSYKKQKTEMQTMKFSKFSTFNLQPSKPFASTTNISI